MTVPSTTRPYHLAADDGPALWHLGALVTFKATTENTAGRMWVQEVTGSQGYASPLHRHSREDEAFYVLGGQVSFYVGDDDLVAGRGSFVWAPVHIPHAFCVESEEATFLAFSTGGAFDRFFFSTGEPAAARAVPPPADGTPDVAALAAALNEYGVEIVGPPPIPQARR